jgi:hypothetical protein
MHLPVIFNRLAPVTSHLEGVGNYHAACAAITLVHYTPPPFVAIILPCICPVVKLLMKIRLTSMSMDAFTSASEGGLRDFTLMPDCEYCVNWQGSNKLIVLRQ